jgi:hypothetical protein
MLLKNKITGSIGEFENHQGEDWIELTESEIAELELQEAIKLKLKELETFHDSDKVRVFLVKTPKNTFFFSTLDKSRNLLAEQITMCYSAIKSGEVTPEKAGFLFSQENPNTRELKSEFISLANIEFIYARLATIVNSNYRLKTLTHIPKINAMKNLIDLSNYDFTKGYIINQVITIE